MPNSVDFSGRPFHFIGIGGIGMSALAYILAKRNLPVSGSDICLNHITQRLQDEGVHVFLSQDAANLDFFRPAPVIASARTVADQAIATETSTTPLEATRSSTLPQVICSTAINPANSEYKAALERNCPIFHRSDVLAALIQEYQSIAVAGTHGKTTTSSMIGYMLMHAELDPTIVVGGEVKAWGGNARVGQSSYLVAEADESDGSLAKLSAAIGVITNIELDHPDHYSNLEEVVDIFKIFAQRCETLVASIDCPTIYKTLRPTLTYSLNPDTGADYTVHHVRYSATHTTAEVWERGNRLGDLSLKLLGDHNLSNSLAAVAVGRHLGLPFSAIASSLAEFEGARRRFEHRGEYNGILFVDDYAHHPSEIRATLSAARLQLESPDSARKRLIAVFQPHRYSRTQVFLKEFAESFGAADHVVTTEIYSASEQNLGHTSGQQLADAIAVHHPNVAYRAALPDVFAYLIEVLQPGDLVLFLGAGNLNHIIPDLTAYYQATATTTEACYHSA